jgi:adenylate kinase
MKKNFFIFLGPPGSGKGTQTDMLAERLKIPAVSPGELLRQEVKNKTVI